MIWIIHRLVICTLLIWFNLTSSDSFESTTVNNSSVNYDVNGESLPTGESHYENWYRLLASGGYSSNRQCHSIPSNMTLCHQRVGYDRLLLPNYFQHESLHEAVDESKAWLGLTQSGCHGELVKLLCSLYAPVCLDDRHATDDLIEPCQELCQDVRHSCLPKMRKFGFDWPDSLRCSRFPSATSRMCIPLSRRDRPQCSGCVGKPSYEGIVTSFCAADVVLVSRILGTQLRPSNSSSASSNHQLLLDPRQRFFKYPPMTRAFPLPQVVVPCQCDNLDALSRALEESRNKNLPAPTNNRWLLMGKLSPDGSSILVEHLSRLDRYNSDMKRAFRSIRRLPSKLLCQLSGATSNNDRGRSGATSSATTNLHYSSGRKSDHQSSTVYSSQQSAEPTASVVQFQKRPPSRQYKYAVAGTDNKQGSQLLMDRTSPSHSKGRIGRRRLIRRSDGSTAGPRGGRFNRRQPRKNKTKFEADVGSSNQRWRKTHKRPQRHLKWIQRHRMSETRRRRRANAHRPITSHHHQRAGFWLA